MPGFAERRSCAAPPAGFSPRRALRRDLSAPTARRCRCSRNRIPPAHCPSATSSITARPLRDLCPPSRREWNCSTAPSEPARAHRQGPVLPVHYCAPCRRPLLATVDCAPGLPEVPSHILPRPCHHFPPKRKQWLESPGYAAVSSAELARTPAQLSHPFPP